MALGYRTLQHWNHWLTDHHLGIGLMSAEKQLFDSLLASHFGKQAVLLGVPNQAHLLEASVITQQTLITPLVPHDKSFRAIEADLRELPILSGSCDLVMLPHTLDLTETPERVIAEACRIVKPEGYLLIAGFNPHSTWGAYKWLAKKSTIPWIAQFIQPLQVKNWLNLADFALEKHKTTLFRPPTQRPSLYQQLSFLEHWGKYMPFLGNIYVLLARAKVLPLTPIKFKLTWKPQLTVMPTSVIGHIARSYQ